MNDPYYQTFGLSSTEASHSWIGTATPLDYNLANIQKNSMIVVNVTVSTPPPNEPAKTMPTPKYLTPQLERAKQIWGEAPGGTPLSEAVYNQRS